MNHFLKKLLDGIEHDERIAVRKRVDLMMGELKYTYLSGEIRMVFSARWRLDWKKLFLLTS